MAADIVRESSFMQYWSDIKECDVEIKIIYCLDNESTAYYFKKLDFSNHIRTGFSKKMIAMLWFVSSHLETATSVKGPGPSGEIRRAGDERVTGVDGGTIVGIKVLSGDEDQGVDALPMALEGPDAGGLLLALLNVQGVKEPGLGRLVVRGWEDEVAGNDDPEVISTKD